MSDIVKHSIDVTPIGLEKLSQVPAIISKVGEAVNRVNVAANPLGKYKEQEDRKLKVIVKGKDKDGKEIQCKPKGKPGGDTTTFDNKGIATQEMLDSIAENIYAAKSYSGYDGGFQTWHLPLIDKGDTTDALSAATKQLNLYAADAQIVKMIGSSRLHKIVMIFKGFEVKKMVEVE